jgi:hypothetical protein
MDKASGTQLIQELITDGCHGVTRYQPTGDKTMRLHAQTALIENGLVHIPETAPWLAEYLHELTVFPKGKHDDQADSTAQCLDWFKIPMSCWGIFELTRRQLNAKVGHFMITTIFGTSAPDGVTPITDQNVRGRLGELFLRTRLGWRDDLNQHEGRKAEWSKQVEDVRRRFRAKLARYAEP